MISLHTRETIVSFLPPLVRCPARHGRRFKGGSDAKVILWKAIQLALISSPVNLTSPVVVKDDLY